MAAFIGEDQVRRVKERTDLVQLMQEYTPLRKVGANFAGCCTFHRERTPSMYVSPERQTYYCFGCGAKGDAITLIREKEHLEFLEAVELLARRANIQLQLDAQSAAKRSQRDRLLPLLAFATDFYERQLWESPGAAEARAYLASRRLSEEVCRRFRLGWAPGNGVLVAEARRKGLPLDLLRVADLAVERGGGLADRFFERVTFPIHDRFGHPVAFSARLLPAAERAAKEQGRGVGKYVNSTETPIYHKGSIVFNLHRARASVRERHRIIVMEGPTDVMAAEQAGYGECVAILGTALTADHARQLGNLVGGEGKVILLLDGDAAGQANGVKGVRTCLAAGVPVRVALLPEQLDPAELLAEGQGAGDGRAVFEQVLAEARHDVDHLLRALAPLPYDLDHAQRLAVADDIIAALRPMPDATLRAMHLRDAAEYFGFTTDQLQARLAQARTVEPRTDEAPARVSATEALGPMEDAILHVLARHPELRAHAADDLNLEPSAFPTPWQPVAFALLREEVDHVALLALPEVIGDPTLHDHVCRWVHTDPSERPIAIGDPRTFLAEQVSRLQLKHLQDQVLRLSRAITDASARPADPALPRLLQERFALERRLSDLRGCATGATPLPPRPSQRRA